MQALRLDHLFFPFTYINVTHKKTHLATQAFQTPTTYPTLHLFTSTLPKTLPPRCHSNLIVVVCRRRGTLSENISVIIFIIWFWKRGHCCSLLLEQRSYCNIKMQRNTIAKLVCNETLLQHWNAMKRFCNKCKKGITTTNIKKVL